MFGVTRYQNSTYAFPALEFDPSKKGEDWHLQYCEALYSYYVRDITSIPFSRREDMILNKLYAEGNQPTTKYTDKLTIKDDKSASRKGWMDMSWDILSVAPKFKAIIMGIFKKIHHDVAIIAMDESSGMERESKKYKAWAATKLEPFFESIGMPTESEDNLPFVPSSIQELEVIQEMGAFKLQIEELAERVIELALEDSSWDTVKEQVYSDLFDQGLAATQDYIDPGSNKVMARWVDPINLIVQYTKQKDFKNIDKWGFVERINISQLIRESQGQFTDEVYEDISSTYAGYAGNASYSDGFSYFQNGLYSTATNQMKDNVVEVVRCEWFSTDHLVSKSSKTKHGHSRYETNKKMDYEPSKRSNNKRIDSKRKMVYRATWIVGTKHIYDWGKQVDIPRDGYYKEDPKLSLNIYKMGDKSMLQSIIPMLDGIQIAWLKIQNAIAKAPPAGLAVEIGALENISMGGQKLKPLEIFTLRRHTGDIVYRATTHHSAVKSGSVAKPITELPGGIGQQLTELLLIMDHNMSWIRDILGISESMAAADINPRTPVGTQKMAAESTNNILYNIYDAYRHIREQTSRNFFLRFQVLALSGRTGYYKKSLGENWLRMLDSVKNVPLATMGIKVEIQPNDDEKAKISEAALVSMQTATQGGIGIVMSDYFTILRHVKRGKIKYAEAYLTYRESQAKDEQAKQAQANIEIQGQQQQQLEAQKAQNAEKAASIQVDIENKKTTHKADEERKTAILQAFLNIEEEHVKLAGEDISATRDHILETTRNLYPGLLPGTESGQGQRQPQQSGPVSSPIAPPGTSPGIPQAEVEEEIIDTTE